MGCLSKSYICIDSWSIGRVIDFGWKGKSICFGNITSIKARVRFLTSISCNQNFCMHKTIRLTLVGLLTWFIFNLVTCCVMEIGLLIQMDQCFGKSSWIDSTVDIFSHFSNPYWCVHSLEKDFKKPWKKTCGIFVTLSSIALLNGAFKQTQVYLNFVVFLTTEPQTT